jgi:prepilin-type N-terminal cleavage/methylation domain-containing protein
MKHLLSNPVRPHDQGFTLVEMAMVLAIVALLLAGLVPTISSQMEQQRINETRKQLEEIRQALIGFAVINGRLPCPAQASLATGAANAGLETNAANACACESASGSAKTIAKFGSGIACADTSVTGVLPWASLGLSETDAWGQRYTYRVSSHFADAIALNTLGCTPGSNPVASSFAICTPGVPDIVDASGNFVFENVPAVVVSHGPNGLGAYTSTGTQIAGAGGDEAENSDNDLTFVSHEFSPGFDDLLIWVSPSTLINRMVAADKLP